MMVRKALLLLITCLPLLTAACQRRPEYPDIPSWQLYDRISPDLPVDLFLPEDTRPEPDASSVEPYLELWSEVDQEVRPDAPADMQPEDLPLDDLLPDELPASDCWDSQETDAAPEPSGVEPLEVLHDEYGGFLSIPVTDPTGFFATGTANGRVWLTTPLGNAFFSTGLSAFRFGGPTGEGVGYSPAQLNDYRNWVEQTGQPMGNAHDPVLLAKTLLSQEYGLNTVGGWSNGAASMTSGTLAGTYSLGFAGGVQSASNTAHPIPGVNVAGFPDVFHPDFAIACQEYASKVISPAQVDDPWNVGYFTDNELHWWGQAFWLESTTTTLADDFIALDGTAPGKLAFVTFMEQRWGGDLDGFNSAYGLALSGFPELADISYLPYDSEDPVHYADRMSFVGEIAEAYFSTVNQALKARDPNHLNLCARFASIAPLVVVRAMARHCDVITLNDYYIPNTPVSVAALGAPSEERWESWVQTVFAETGPKPFVITEWGVRGDDSGLPNTYGAGQTVPTQQDRIETIRSVTDWLVQREHEGLGYVSGWHWFMHEDQPPTGRWDGEDSNYGVVTVRNERYLWLLDAMKAVNLAVENRLAHGVSPTLLGAPAKPVTVEFPAPDTVHVSWAPVAGAASYRVTALSHPAGIAGRILGQVETTDTQTDIPLVGVADSFLWFAVEAVHPDLLTAGFRVSEPVMAPPCPVSDIGLVLLLAADTLCFVHYDNLVLSPNVKAGLSYARLADPLEGNEGHSILLEFVPSSLGLVTSNLPGPEQMEVVFQLPAGVAVSPGQSLSLLVRPGPVVTPVKALVAASDFVDLLLCTTEGECPLSFPLSQQELPHGVVSSLSLPLAEQMEVHQVVFRVALKQEHLPMEHRVMMAVDSLSFQ